MLRYGTLFELLLKEEEPSGHAAYHRMVSMRYDYISLYSIYKPYWIPTFNQLNLGNINFA